MSEKVEYQVRPTERYIVTKYTSSERGESSEQRGEFDNFETAYAVGCALAKADHDRLGYPPGDERVQYPKQIIRGGAERL